MKRFDDVAGFVLAGGASSRMGRDKALLAIGGVPLLLRIARVMNPLVGGVAVIGPPERYGHLGLPVVPDERAGLGPLGGIATALHFSTRERNLVLSCDLPYLSASWLEQLIAWGVASAADAVLPETSRGLEPLCAMYRKRCGPALAAALSSGVRKITEGLAGLAVERITEQEWKAFDSAGRLFKNMNTPEDYEEAQVILGGKAR